MSKKIELEHRYLADDLNETRAKLLKLRATLVKEVRLVDHWFIPNQIQNQAQHDKWYDVDLGVAARIRETFICGSLSSIEFQTKTLLTPYDHEHIAESEPIDYASLKEALRNDLLKERREFLTIDKQRQLYRLDGFEISLDEIKGFGCGVEIELIDEPGVGSERQIKEIACKLELEPNKRLKKSLTVLAMEQLAHFS